MERKMTCFQWQSRISDFMDESLPPSDQRAAQDHWDHCSSCKKREEHITAILSKIAMLKSYELPENLKGDIQKDRVKRAEAFLNSISRWSYLPWYLRTLLQATGIIVMVLAVISAAPTLRGLYERSVERSLSEFSDKTLLASLDSSTENQGLSQLQPAASIQGNALVIAASESEIEGEEEPSPSQLNYPVARAPLWRFTLKTVSPDELKNQVTQTLQSLHIGLPSSDLIGVQVPGGIEFSLILSEDDVVEVKEALTQLMVNLSKTANENQTQVNADQGSQKESAPTVSNDKKMKNFSWYRVMSRQKLPPGKSKVMIWLAQPIQ